MPVAEFDRSLTKVLVFEGGYVNDPDDPGPSDGQRRHASRL